MRPKGQLSRRQAEALTDSPDLDACTVQAREASRPERDAVSVLVDDIERELAAEIDLRFEFRTATEPTPVLTPWMRMDPEERAAIRQMRRRARFELLPGKDAEEVARIRRAA